eukprot:scaffold6611_cov150-Amphora_coffeaeformis.AAC.5
MSTPPRQAQYGGGSMEYGQNIVMQKIRSAHNLYEIERRRQLGRGKNHHLNNSNKYGSTSNGGSYNSSNNKSERDPLLQVEEGKPENHEEDKGQQQQEQQPRHLPPDQAHKVYNFLLKRGSSMESCEADSSPGLDFDHMSLSSHPSSPKMAQLSQTIRFQVLIWNVGALDVVQGRVPVTFRVTIFWNDVSCIREDLDAAIDSNDSASIGPQRLWEMRGRQKAVPARESRDEAAGQAIDVPPVSILNVVTFDTIGAPDITLLRQDTGLWQWTCMYRATLMQDHWNVANFPHDEHEICLKLAVLANRKADARWDRRVWQLGLATEKDSMGCVRVPHGLIVGDLSIPEFTHDNDLKFNFGSLDIGPGGTLMSERCLVVKIKVRRNSHYYDRNIVPLLAMLNLVALTITGLGADKFFERGLLTLNIAFVEISIRMATDKNLPSVPYQIKLQKVLNEYFFGLLLLVLESNLVFELHRYGLGRFSGPIDLLAAGTVLTHNMWTLYDYYVVSRRAK